MTLDKTYILSLEPGRKLDAIVAEHVMKQNVVLQNTVIQDGSELHLLPKYSTDISAAWQVVEKIHASGQSIYIDCFTRDGQKLVMCQIMTDNGVPEVTVCSASEAICKTALLAVLNLIA